MTISFPTLSNDWIYIYVSKAIFQYARSICVTKNKCTKGTLSKMLILYHSRSAWDLLTLETCITWCTRLSIPIVLLYLSTTLWAWWIREHRDKTSTLPLPPGDFGWPIVGHTLHLILEVLQFFSNN